MGEKNIFPFSLSLSLFCNCGYGNKQESSGDEAPCLVRQQENAKILISVWLGPDEGEKDNEAAAGYTARNK